MKKVFKPISIVLVSILILLMMPMSALASGNNSLYLDVHIQLVVMGSNGYKLHDQTDAKDANIIVDIPGLPSPDSPGLTDDDGKLTVTLDLTMFDDADGPSLITFIPDKRGYSKVGLMIDLLDLKNDPNIELEMTQIGVINGTFNLGHLPADDKGISPGYRTVRLYQEDDNNKWFAVDFTQLVATTVAESEYAFEHVHPGNYKVAFGFRDDSSFPSFEEEFQFYNGVTGATTLEDALSLEVKVGDDIKNIDTVSWAGDRDHATLDQITPYVSISKPDGVNHPTSGFVSLTFSEAMRTTPGNIILECPALPNHGAESHPLNTGTWSAGNTIYTAPFSDLTNGRLYQIMISGFQDLAGNTITSRSVGSFAIEGGQVQREISSTGITVSGNISPDAVLVEKPIALHSKGSDPACDAIHDADGEGLLLAQHDISVNFGSFTGPLTITIPVSPVFNGKTVSVLHCNDGELETIMATVTDGKVKFELYSLSPIAIALATDDDQADNSNNNPNSPDNTGNPDNNSNPDNTGNPNNTGDPDNNTGNPDNTGNPNNNTGNPDNTGGNNSTTTQNNASAQGNTNTPKTGDDTNITLLFALMILAALSILAIKNKRTKINS